MSLVMSLQFSVSYVIQTGSLLPFGDITILKSYKFGCIQYLCTEKQQHSGCFTELEYYISLLGKKKMTSLKT